MPLDIDLNVAFTNNGETPLLERKTMAASNTGSSCDFQFDLNHPPCLHVEDEFQFDLNHPPCLHVEDDTGQSVPCFDEDEDQTNLNHPPCLPVQDDIGQSVPYFDEDEDTDLNQPSCLPVQDEANHIDPRLDEDEGHVNHDTMPIVTGETSSRKRNFLTNEQRKAICHMLLHSSHNGKPNRGVMIRICSLYNVKKSVIYRIWSQLKETGNAHHKKSNCGRKRVQLDLQRVLQVPLSKRTTLRSLAHALDINKSSLIRLQKAGVIRRHSNALKPHLKEENMIARLRFCLSMLDDSSMPHDPRFKSMHNVVFIDEKWFYITKKSTNYYLLADEGSPHRTCKSKNFIGKLMFLVAVARPRFDNEGNETFSGKIGVFPFVNEQPARRTSVNRVAGTMEKKAITSVTREVNKTFLINQVLPAIKNVWPREDVGKAIFIQQDNARCHVDKDDEDFCRAASEGGFHIQLTCQPPNSPDLNVLDLGFFNAIQSLQQKESTKSVDDLIEAVEKSFDAFSAKQSNKIFLTLQSCMVEIMKIKGSNKYKIPHMKKDVLYNQQGGIPTQLRCDPSLIQEVTQYIENVDAS